MTQETGQFDDLKRQLLITDTQPRKNTWTDIGEAQVTLTIFGRARVRIIRKKDNIRRAVLLTLAALGAIAAIWQGWIGTRQTEPQQSAVNEPASSGAAPLDAPAVQSEPAPLRDDAPPVQNKPVMPQPVDIKATAAVQKSAPPQPPVKAPEPVAAKPAMARPLPALKSQAPAATAVEPPPGKPPAASSPATDVPAVTEETGRPEPPSASSTAAVAAPVPEPSPPQSPADDLQQGDAVSEPGK